MKKRIAWVAVGVIIILAAASSGWVYNIIAKNNELMKANELANVMATFTQEYGNQVIVDQLVSPEKVYAARWRSTSDNITRISWNIGGVWGLVKSLPTP